MMCNAISIGRHFPRKTRYFHVSFNGLHVSTIDVHVQLRLFDARQHERGQCRVQQLVAASAHG